MILSNSRIEKNENITFYEQDIIIDDKIYSDNIEVEIIFDYISPGIGIALIENEGLTLNEYSTSYLFKIGFNKYELIRNISNKQSVLETGTMLNYNPFYENLKLKIKKDNDKVYMYLDNKLLMQRYLPNNIENFNIGYYSAAGNIIKNIKISSNIPNGWNINMNNTNGGYINFNYNSFTITECSDLAEVEQSNIFLKANDKSNKCYYLKYEVENINNENDIKAYVSLSKDDRYDDEKKNILNNNKFILKEDDYINLKFKGTIGTIKNIQITNKKEDTYISTEYNQGETNASFIKINTSELEKIEFKGYINSIPKRNIIFEEINYAIIEDYKKKYGIEELNIEVATNTLYDFKINLSDNTMTITNNSIFISRTNLNINNEITIFKNIDAVITEFILYKKDGTKLDIINQSTRKEYVPGNIKTPIIITDENGNPLELSSSYRYCNNKYVFTNYEREIFNATNKIKLSNDISKNLDTITIYCINKEAKTNEDKIFNIENNNINSINNYANIYDTFYESNIYSINKDTSTILLKDSDKDDIATLYKSIIVDYLKKDSYCINYNYDLSMYEVDISSDKNLLIYYDGIGKEINNTVNISNHKLLNLGIENNKYIVLKGR